MRCGNTDVLIHGYMQLQMRCRPLDKEIVSRPEVFLVLSYLVCNSYIIELRHNKDYFVNQDNPNRQGLIGCTYCTSFHGKLPEVLDILADRVTDILYFRRAEQREWRKGAPAIYFILSLHGEQTHAFVPSFFYLF